MYLSKHTFWETIFWTLIIRIHYKYGIKFNRILMQNAFGPTSKFPILFHSLGSVLKSKNLLWVSRQSLNYDRLEKSKSKLYTSSIQWHRVCIIVPNGSNGAIVRNTKPKQDQTPSGQPPSPVTLYLMSRAQNSYCLPTMLIETARDNMI